MQKFLPLALLTLPLAVLSQPHQHTPAASAALVAPRPGDAAKIRDARSAAPAAVSKNATIMDWPATPQDKSRLLVAGKDNGAWVCFPSTPVAGAKGGDPMCLDKQWQAWAEGWAAKTVPKVTGTGIAYMLRGDRGASNTDPYATGATATNEWVVAPPHVMVLFADTKALDAWPTDPKTGGPWVMWHNTPYAHLMVPVSQAQIATVPLIKGSK